MPIALIFPKPLSEFNILQQIGLDKKCLQNETTEKVTEKDDRIEVNDFVYLSVSQCGLYQ